MSIREEIKSRLNSQFSTHCQRIFTSRFDKKNKIQNSDVIFPENKPVSRWSTPLKFQSGFLRLNDMTSQHQTAQKSKTQHCREAVGTFTRAVASASASKPQSLLCARPSCAVARPQKPSHQLRRFDSALLALLPLRRRLVTRN